MLYNKRKTKQNKTKIKQERGNDYVQVRIRNQKRTM